MPLTHELAPRLHLGSLHRAPLAQLAAAWLTGGPTGSPADALAALCERTWEELTRPDAPHACYWYDEVAARSHARPLPIELRTDRLARQRAI